MLFASSSEDVEKFKRGFTNVCKAKVSAKTYLKKTAKAGQNLKDDITKRFSLAKRVCGKIRLGSQKSLNADNSMGPASSIIKC